MTSGFEGLLNNDHQFFIMAFIAYHPAFKHSLPKGHRFPMVKYELLYEQLLYEGVAEEKDFFRPDLLSKNNLSGVHDRIYTQRLFQLQLSEKEIRRIGFPLNEGLIERELRIAQESLVAAEVAMEEGIGFNIAGGTHHAGSNWGEGFCLLNDQAIAARNLISGKNLSRILIIDLDVHQGNGTAEIFAREKRIFTFSMHGRNNFPFRKEKSDLDIGLPDETNGSDYLCLLDKNLKRLFSTLSSGFVFYQAGVDVLETDKMGRLLLTLEDCRQRDKLVFNYCKRYGVPAQVSMGGGYSPEIKDIVNAHCQTFKEGIAALH